MKSPLNYNGDLTCSVGVKDLDRSLAWYRDVLGFRLLYRVDEIGWCELATEIPGVNLGLSQVEDPEGRGGATPVFGVKDIESAKRMLEERKVRFDGDIQVIEGMVKLATFYDPDGNSFMLSQDLMKKGLS